MLMFDDSLLSIAAGCLEKSFRARDAIRRVRNFNERHTLVHTYVWVMVRLYNAIMTGYIVYIYRYKINITVVFTKYRQTIIAYIHVDFANRCTHRSRGSSLVEDRVRVKAGPVILCNFHKNLSWIICLNVWLDNAWFLFHLGLFK